MSRWSEISNYTRALTHDILMRIAKGDDGERSIGRVKRLADDMMILHAPYMV